MFDKEGLRHRLQAEAGFDDLGVKDIFGTLTDPELEVANDDPFIEARDFDILRRMKTMPRDEFERKSVAIIHPQYLGDYVMFSAHWENVGNYFRGIDIFRRTGQEASRNAITMHDFEQRFHNSARCRVFYCLKHPDRIEGYGPQKIPSAA